MTKRRLPIATAAAPQRGLCIGGNCTQVAVLMSKRSDESKTSPFSFTPPSTYTAPPAPTAVASVRAEGIEGSVNQVQLSGSKHFAEFNAPCVLLTPPKVYIFPLVLVTAAPEWKVCAKGIYSQVPR